VCSACTTRSPLSTHLICSIAGIGVLPYYVRRLLDGEVRDFARCSSECTNLRRPLLLLTSLPSLALFPRCLQYPTIRDDFEKWMISRRMWDEGSLYSATNAFKADDRRAALEKSWRDQHAQLK
jgi:hypothetical protein